MPKRSREEASTLAERLDGEWVGRWVMLKPAAARGKRLPETLVAKVCRVTRSGTTAAVVLQYSANGVTKTYTDSFPRGEAFSTRYLQVQEAAAPLDKEQFLRQWCFRGPTQSAPRSGEALGAILPEFQLETNITVPRAVGANTPDGRRAAVAAVLACSIQPFQFGDIFRVECGGLSFETTSNAVRAEAHARLLRDGHLQGVFQGRAPPDASTRRLGRCTLHPWQAAVLARVMQLMQSPERMLADFRCWAGHDVRVQCLVPQTQKAAVLNAGTGMGKTFVAAALALDRLTFCIVLPNSTRQWAQQATLTGAHAVWAESTEALKRAVAARTADGASRGGLVIFSHTLLRSHHMQQQELATPDLIIVDEIHKASDGFPEAVFRFLKRFRSVFALGLTATLGSDDGNTEKEVARMLGLDVRALPAAVIRVPSCANAAVYPASSFEFRKVRMSNIERSAYTVARETRGGVIRALLFPATGTDADGYELRVWRDIMRTLSEANKRVEKTLVNILTRTVQQQAYHADIEGRLGPSAASRIYELVAEREPPESFDSGPQTQRRLDEVWASRTRLLGAYAFAAGVLSRLGAAASVECPVCFDSVDQYYVARCGHFVCEECLPRVRGCPLCRASNPVWRSGAALREELAASEDTQAEEQRQTSGKFYELARIIHALGESERVLVVSPLRSMLDDVRTEMSKLGVKLAILRGGAVEQQATLRAWQGGGYKGLLSDPDLPSLNLSEASTVVFLSPMLTETQFTQAAGRVVRQGSLRASVRVIVLGAANTIEDEDAGKLERFRAIAERSAPSAGSSGA